MNFINAVFATNYYLILSNAHNVTNLHVIVVKQTGSLIIRNVQAAELRFIIEDSIESFKVCWMLQRSVVRFKTVFYKNKKLPIKNC